MESFDLRSEAALEVYEELSCYAYHGRRCILFGPTGAGKEHAAYHYYEEYKKAQGGKEMAFHSLNCAALSPTIAGSELFGHVKGAFTNACSNRTGAFETAKGNVLFLDEIGDLPDTVVPMLLRALDSKNGNATKLGSDVIYSTTDVTVICATEKPLTAIRPSLRARLGLQVFLPGIDKRREDVAPAVHHLAKRAMMKCQDSIALANKFGPRPDGKRMSLLSEETALDSVAQVVADALLPEVHARVWPENFRALSTAIDSAVIRAAREGCIEDYAADVVRCFRAHSVRYSDGSVLAPVVSTQVAVPVSVVQTDDTLQQRLLGILPATANRVDDANALAEFLASRAERPFLRSELEPVLPQMSKRTVLDRINLLIRHGVLRKESSQWYVYASDCSTMSTSRDFLGSDRFVAPAMTFEVVADQKDLALLWRQAEGTGGMYLSGADRETRMKWALGISQSAEPGANISYFRCDGVESLADLITAVEDALVDRKTLRDASIRDRSLTERMAYVAGYVNGQCQGRQHVLIVDGAENLATGRDQALLVELARVWPWFQFIVCGDKMGTQFADMFVEFDVAGSLSEDKK